MTFREILDVAKEELDPLTSLSKPDFRLEQAEYKSEEGVWDVVVSYLVENTNKRLSSPLVSFATEFQYHRIYKKLKINNDKKVIGFYIYDNKNDNH